MPYTHTHPFNGSFSRTTWVSHYLGRYSVDTVLVSQSSSSEGVATDHSRSHIHEMADNTHTHVYRPFSRVSQYQRGKTNLDFTEAKDGEWQWH